MKNILTPICQAWLNEPATLKGAALPISPRFLGKYSLFFQKKVTHSNFQIVLFVAAVQVAQ